MTAPCFCVDLSVLLVLDLCEILKVEKTHQRSEKPLITLKVLQSLGRLFIIQQKNDSKHFPYLVLARHRVNVIDWYSPESNIVEHHWYEMENLLRTMHVSNMLVKFQ